MTLTNFLCNEQGKQTIGNDTQAWEGASWIIRLTPPAINGVVTRCHEKYVLEFALPCLNAEALDIGESDFVQGLEHAEEFGSLGLDPPWESSALETRACWNLAEGAAVPWEPLKILFST